MKEGKWQGLGGWWGVNESVGYLKLGDDFFGTSNSVEWISLQLKLLKFTQPLQPRSFLFSTSSDATNLFLGDSSYSGLGQDLLLDCILIRLVICIFIYIYIYIWSFLRWLNIALGQAAPKRGKTPWTDLGGHWWCRFSGQVPKPRVRIWVSGWLEEFFFGEFRVVRGKTCVFFFGVDRSRGQAIR